MVKFMYMNKELCIGDRVGITVKLNSSTQNVNGWVVSTPRTKSGSFIVKLEPGHGRETSYLNPTVSDLLNVTVKEGPDNWPPQEHDVWEADRLTWHFIDGKFISDKRWCTYSSSQLDDFLKYNPKAVLKYRRKS